MATTIATASPRWQNPPHGYVINPSIDALIDASEGPLNRRVEAHVARTQFGQLMDRAVRNKERFVVDRRGEPAVVILSVQDYLDTVPSAPEWLRRAWAEAKGRKGQERMTMERIDAEIDAYRPPKQAAAE